MYLLTRCRVHKRKQQQCDGYVGGWKKNRWMICWEKNARNPNFQCMFQSGTLSLIPNLGFKVIMKIKKMKRAGKKKKNERETSPVQTHELICMQPNLLPLSLCLSLSTREWLTLLLLRLARSGWCLDLLAVLALLLRQVRMCIVVAQARTVLVALPTDWHTHTVIQKCYSDGS